MNDVTGIGSGLAAISRAIFLLVFFLFVMGIAMGFMGYHIVNEHFYRNDKKSVEAPVKTDTSPPKANSPPVRPKEVEAPREAGPSDGGEVVLPIPPVSEGGKQDAPIYRR